MRDERKAVLAPVLSSLVQSDHSSRVEGYIRILLENDPSLLYYGAKGQQALDLVKDSKIRNQLEEVDKNLKEQAAE